MDWSERVAEQFLESTHALVELHIETNKTLIYTMRQQAIIIKTMPIKESDQLIVCYTRDAGKQRYRTKSSLLPTSKQGPHLQVLNHIDFSLVQGNGHDIMTSAYCVEAFRALKDNLKAIAITSFFIECFDKLVFDNEPDLKLWDFLYETLRHYDNAARDPQTDWRTALKQSYGQFMSAMGYHGDTAIQELHHAQFDSLRFIDSVV